jgi:hypothetical protein
MYDHPDCVFTDLGAVQAVLRDSKPTLHAQEVPF